jgi:hypothetical protein
MAREVRAVELEAKVVVTWMAWRLRKTGTIDGGGGGDSTCGGVLLLGRERMVLAARAVEWEAEVVEAWAAAKALPVDSMIFVVDLA